jgi:glycoside/pentoside/hexuronide:cation symporter, GPH family
MGGVERVPLVLRDRLPVSVVLAYGYGSLAVYVAPMITAFFLNPFLLEVAGIPPATVGLIMLVGNFFDAFSDPLIGFLSDRTPWGPKRLPWIAFATIPFVYFYVILWVVPPWPTKVLIAYYTLIYVTRTFFLTCINVPYNSLSAELTQSYDERSRLAGSRYALSSDYGGSLTFEGLDGCSLYFWEPCVLSLSLI